MENRKRDIDRDRERERERERERQRQRERKRERERERETHTHTERGRLNEKDEKINEVPLKRDIEKIERVSVWESKGDVHRKTKPKGDRRINRKK